MRHKSLVYKKGDQEYTYNKCFEILFVIVVFLLLLLFLEPVWLMNCE